MGERVEWMSTRGCYAAEYMKVQGGYGGMLLGRLRPAAHAIVYARIAVP